MKQVSTAIKNPNNLPIQTLNVNDPNQVFSPQMLEMFVGDPQSNLLIFTGIAVPRWDSHGKQDCEIVIVKLGKTVIEKPEDGEWSATVGLASIANTDSDFTFATNSVLVDIDDNNELQLIVEIAVQGDTSVLNSFSYQVNILVKEKQAELQLLLVSDNEGILPPNTQLTIEPGFKWKARILLNRPALNPGVFVRLTSNNPIVQVPQEFIHITAGQTVSQDIPEPAVGETVSKVDVTITASLNSVNRQALITVLPLPK